jgi:steroid delta-isomerase-like uncharacterized protein
MLKSPNSCGETDKSKKRFLMRIDNTEIIEQLLEEAWNKRNLAVIDEWFTADAVVHDPSMPEITDVVGLKQFIAAYLAAFPDLHFMLDDCFAAEDKVATQWTVRGVHKGAFLGMAPTEQPVTVTGISLYRLTGGKVTECRTQWDSSGLVRQFGHVTPTESSPGA